MVNWKALTRPDQNALQVLYGGGSLRTCDPVVIARLRQFGLIEVGRDRQERLSPSGWELMNSTHAKITARLYGPGPKSDLSSHDGGDK